MIAPLVFRHASHWKIPKVSAWQIFYLWHIQKYLPNHPEKHPIATLCFSTAAAAAAPSASHPRRPRRDGAASGGLGRPLRRGRAADLCGGQGGRGQHSRPWPWKGFRVVLGVALARWRKGLVHGQGIFVLCLLFKDPLLWWDGPLEIRVWEMAKHGGQRHEWNGKQKDVDADWPMTSQSSAWPDLMQSYCGCFGYWAAKATDISQWKREGGAEDAAHENVGQQA